MTADGRPVKKKERENSEIILFVGAKRALIGGLLAAATALLGQLLVGRVYSSIEALRLLEASIPSARSVGTAVVTASATILALMLTMLGLSRQDGDQLSRRFFKEVEQIGLFTSISLVASILLLVLLSFPVQESGDLPSSWYSIIYYILTTATALIAGLLVAVVLLLYSTIRSLFEIVVPSPETESDQESLSSAGPEPSVDPLE